MNMISCLKYLLILILALYFSLIFMIVFYFGTSYYNFNKNKLHAANNNNNFNNKEHNNKEYNYPRLVNVPNLPFKTNSRNIPLEDILITIKTGSTNHKTRLKYIASTWYRFARSQIYAITDLFDSETNNLYDGKLIPTDCNPSRIGLCCKFGSELNLFFNLIKPFKWFCHFDDDNYVNIPNLVELLSKYNHNDYHFLGKSSWNVPVVRTGPKKFLPGEYAKFWFASFGAGVCLSNATMYKIKEHANAQTYTTGCNNMGLPDDTYLGFLLEWQNKINFTNITTMNHHLEVDQFKNMENIANQVTFGFGQTYFDYFDEECNCTRKLWILPKIANLYDENEDPLLLKSLHCLIFPETDNCKILLTKSLEKMRHQEKSLVQLKRKVKALEESNANYLLNLKLCSNNTG